VTQFVRACLLAGLATSMTTPVLAQGPAPALNPTPPLLLIYREEVKPGKAAAHAANEATWAAALAKAGVPTTWIAMTTLAGPTEAWFLTGVDSYDSWEKMMKAEEANEALTAEVDRLSAQDGELLTRTSALVGSYRPNLSYQTDVKLPEMRYVRADIVRVKPGRGREFVEAWVDIIAAHQKAKMDEHWAVYQITAGMPDTTYVFLYPFKSLAEADKAGPMHGADAYRDAVGESGRAMIREMNQVAVEFSQSLLFRMSPRMSAPPKAWIDADPAFWTPKPSPPAKPAVKK
jgi:hypothetical protein